MKTLSLQPLRLIHIVLAAVVLLAACQSQTAQIPETGSQESSLSIEIGDEAVTTPEQVPAGIVAVMPEVTAQSGRNLMLARLNPDVSAEQLTEALAESPEAALPLITFVGGRMASPGVESQFTADLEPGTYIALGFPVLENQVPIFSFFEAVEGEGEGAAAPQAETVVELIDFDFTMPESIQAGGQLVEVRNTGKQPHEIYIIKPAEGFTEEQFMQMMQSQEESSGPPPWEDADFFGPLSGGETGWFTLDLEPGTYMALCFIPDVSGSMQPHAALGMVKTFEVVASGE